MKVGVFRWSMDPEKDCPRYDVMYAGDVIYEYGSAINSSSENNVGGEGGGVIGLMITVRAMLKADEGCLGAEANNAASVPQTEDLSDVVNGLADRDWDDDYENTYFTSVRDPLYTGGYFYLALTRRSVPFEIILAIVERVGLVYDGVLQGSTKDLFGNETDGPTEFWTDLIMVIRKKDRNGQ